MNRLMEEGQITLKLLGKSSSNHTILYLHKLDIIYILPISICMYIYKHFK